MNSKPSPRQLLFNLTIMGTLPQIAMVVAGHFNEFIKTNLFAALGTTLSLIFGTMYGRKSSGTVGQSLLGGAFVGAVSALIGVMVSVSLGDVPAMILAVGTISGVAAGGIGAAIAAALRKRKAATLSSLG